MVLRVCTVSFGFSVANPRVPAKAGTHKDWLPAQSYGPLLSQGRGKNRVVGESGSDPVESIATHGKGTRRAPALSGYIQQKPTKWGGRTPGWCNPRFSYKGHRSGARLGILQGPRYFKIPLLAHPWPFTRASLRLAVIRAVSERGGPGRLVRARPALTTFSSGRLASAQSPAREKIRSDQGTDPGAGRPKLNG